MDHFWIILGPFWTILLIALSTLCQWSCGLADHFLEVTLLEQVNFHFGFFFFTTHCWSKMLLRDTYIWKLHLWIIFCNTNWWINVLFVRALGVTYAVSADHFSCL